MVHMTAIKCAYCGKPGEAKTSEINRGMGRYCSKPCSAAHSGIKLKRFVRSPVRHIEKKEKEYGWD